MTPSQLERRKTLLARSDAALDRWPDRKGSEFVHTMTAVAEGLEALAKAADRSGNDAIERARTWRHVGNAYFDLGAGGKRPQLEQAAVAFRKAEPLLDGADNPVETMKLNYSFGRTLMLLCEKDVQLAAEARDRFATALKLARTHMPAGVSSVDKALRDAEQAVALLTQADGLSRRIDQLKSELRSTEAKPQPAAVAAPRLSSTDIQSLFGVLQQEFEKDKPSLEPTRRAGLEDFMQRLGNLVASETPDKSLADMQAGRGKLEALMREIQAQGKKPSLKGPGAPAGSRSERILAALQDLKMFVWTTGMQQGMPAGTRNAAIELFPRIGRLTTWINEAGGDSTKVRQLESDQARGLANEVRRLARHAHLMLARPVWSHHGGLVEPNRIFFSGPARVREAVSAAATTLGLELSHSARAGADLAEHRWQDLRAANVAVFDLSDAEPQVYYELGVALAVGAQLLLIAEESTNVPFDVAQSIHTYSSQQKAGAFLADELDGALYGLHVRAGKQSSLAHTLAYAERLASADRANALLGVALKTVREAGADPVPFENALNTLNSYLGERQHEILLPRWPGEYPDPHAPRLFAVMPFRDEPQRAYAVVEAAARQAGVEPVRGDVAEGQQIIESIWQEICRATHITVDLTGLNLNVCLELGIAHALGRRTWLVAREGTEQTLNAKLPSVAKWRCHTYAADPRGKPTFHAALAKFFSKTEAV